MSYHLFELQNMAKKNYGIDNLSALLSVWLQEENDIDVILQAVDLTKYKFSAILSELIANNTKSSDDYQILMDCIIHHPSGKPEGEDLLLEICKQPHHYLSHALASNGIDLHNLVAVMQQATALTTQASITAPILSDDPAMPLLKYGIELTAEAKTGAYDTLGNRPDALKKVVSALLRTNKPCAVLTGPAGSGKTSIMQLFAKAIIEHNVPLLLQNKRVFEIRLNDTDAGTKWRGDFEKNFQEIFSIAEANSNIILFIDEIHKLASIGSHSNEAHVGANIIKPYLTTGKIQLIGATTIDEYKLLQNDGALNRRLEDIRLPPLTFTQIVGMVSAQVLHLSKVHALSISDEIINKAIELSDRHQPNFNQPDKSITLLEDCAIDAAQNESEQITLNDLETKMEEKTGHYIKPLSTQEGRRLKQIPARLKTEIIGQDHAIEQTCRLIISRIVKKTPQQNLGNLFFSGDTGLGKTKLALALAKTFFNDESACLRLNLAEYNTAGSVYQLFGSPYDSNEEGVVFAWINRYRRGVILLDEVEEAHEDVQMAFLALMDDPSKLINKNNHRIVDATSYVIVMTSNAIKQNTTKQVSVGFIEQKDNDTSVMLEEHFPKKFLSRINSKIVFKPFNKSDKIAILKLHFAAFIKEQGWVLEYDQALLLAYLLNKLEQRSHDARDINNLFETELKEPISFALAGLDHILPYRIVIDKDFYTDQQIHIHTAQELS